MFQLRRFLFTCATTLADEPADQEDAVREAVMKFVRAIDRLDLDAVAASFTEDATALLTVSHHASNMARSD